MTDLESTRVLVTGAASGLGKQLSRHLGKRGAQLCLWDLNGPGLEALAAELRSVGVEVFVDTCNVAEPASVAAAAERLEKGPGVPQVIINNAGVVSGKSFKDSGAADFQRVLGVNALGPMLVTRAFLPALMRENRGHVVTIASAAALSGIGGMVDYSASKWAAMGFDEGLRQELRRQAPGVRTTVVCPYFIDTGMFAGAKPKHRWLLPILREEAVASRVIRAIEGNRRRILIPRVLGLAWILRYLPVRWFDAWMDLWGFNRAMDTFAGRTAEETLRQR